MEESASLLAEIAPDLIMTFFSEQDHLPFEAVIFCHSVIREMSGLVRETARQTCTFYERLPQEMRRDFSRFELISSLVPRESGHLFTWKNVTETICSMIDTHDTRRESTSHTTG